MFAQVLMLPSSKGWKVGRQTARAIWCSSIAWVWGMQAVCDTVTERMEEHYRGLGLPLKMKLVLSEQKFIDARHMLGFNYDPVEDR